MSSHSQLGLHTGHKAHMSETPIRGDTAERALLTMPAGAVNEEVRAATEESIAK